MSTKNITRKLQSACHSDEMRLASKSDALWDAFIARIKEEMESGWGAQARLAQRLRVTPGNIKKWLGGDIRTANYADMLRYMDALNIKLEDVFRDYEPSTCGYGYVRKVQAKLGAGSSLITNGDVDGMYAFRQDFINEMGGNADNLVMFDVMGDSMEPTIPDGSAVLVNLRDTDVRSGLIYAIRVEEELMVKRLFKNPGKLVCKSDNDLRPDIEVEGDNPDFSVFGRVRWTARRM